MCTDEDITDPQLLPVATLWPYQILFVYWTSFIKNIGDAQRTTPQPPYMAQNGYPTEGASSTVFVGGREKPVK